MIDLRIKIHDKFSIEFKVSYLVDKNIVRNDYSMNTWIFLPNSLDINRTNYSKAQFYKGIKSNLRLITPEYSLDTLSDNTSLPNMFMFMAINGIINEDNADNAAEYEYQIKMFSSILKSSLRTEIEKIIALKISMEDDVIIDRIKNYEFKLGLILEQYRSLKKQVIDSKLNEQYKNYIKFGDEFISNIVEQYSYKLLNFINLAKNDKFKDIKFLILKIINDEINYKKAQGYFTIEENSKDKNRKLVFRRKMLKKYIGSHLFLQVDKKRDGIIAEQIYFSIAAGLSMIVATALAFSFQQRYDNYTMPLFVAMVISYMLKDRIKDLARYYFVHRLSKKYYDNITKVRLKGYHLGEIKEGVDFISEDKIPKEILSMRNRSDIVQAQNRAFREDILLYRKNVVINARVLDDNNQYHINGINDIFRLNISDFMQMMDNAEITLPVPADNKRGYNVVIGGRTYYLNFVMQFNSNGKITYKKFRLLLSRNGIEGIEYF